MTKTKIAKTSTKNVTIYLYKVVDIFTWYEIQIHNKNTNEGTKKNGSHTKAVKRFLELSKTEIEKEL
jgi:hypothetical protein